jgi:hypothetical protein
MSLVTNVIGRKINVFIVTPYQILFVKTILITVIILTIKRFGYVLNIGNNMK